MRNYAVPTNSARLTRRQIGLVQQQGGLAAPFYIPSEVMSAGAPVVRSATANYVDLAAVAEGASVIGLAMQDVYSEANMGQLAGYHYSNDTRQSLDSGLPVGVLTGSGYALTNYYTGAVVWGDTAYVTASGLSASSASGAELPIIFESSGTDGATMVRIRYNFDKNLA